MLVQSDGPVDVTGQTLRSLPRYRPSEAARWLGVPDSTVRRWLVAEECVDGSPEATRLIPSEQTEWCRQALSFLSLVAIHNLRLMLTAGHSKLRHVRFAFCHYNRALLGQAPDGAIGYSDPQREGPPQALSSRKFPVPIGCGWDFARAWTAGVRYGEPKWAGKVFGVHYDDDGQPEMLDLPIPAGEPVLRINPLINFGQPSFIRGSAPLHAVRSRLMGGEALAAVAADYGVAAQDVRRVMDEGPSAKGPRTVLRLPRASAALDQPLIVDQHGKLWRAGPTQAFCSCGWEGPLRRDSHEACADIDTHRAEFGGRPDHDTLWRFADLPRTD